MNTANLQIEGLLTALAQINQALVEKGLLERGEVDMALAKAEQIALGDDRVAEALSAAHRDAIAFPIRLLRLANESSEQSFSDLARRVGETKGPHNDRV